MGVIAVRNESVRLSLQDDFTSGMARAAVATRALDAALNDLDGSQTDVGRSARTTSQDVDALGTSSRRASPEINRLSGRLRIIAETAAFIGPSLVPISAMAIPALSGLSAQLGFAAVGAGSVISAFQGVGDAVGAMNDYALDPTTANLEAAREAMALIGPDAQRFVVAVRDMMPALREVRDASAEGLFGGGLTQAAGEFEQLLPRIADIFGAVGQAAGEFALETAQSLNSDRWRPFLDFIEAEAPGALTELGRTMGNFTHGLAEMWMAFDPLNDDFSNWLFRQSQAFDRWAQGLSDSRSFQDFIDYIRVSGPQVAEAMGAVGSAVLDVVKALAPLGGPSLQIIESFADALAALARSDLGTPLLAAAAAVGLLNRSLATFSAVGRTAFGARLTGGAAAYAASLTAVTTAQDRARLSASALMAQEQARRQSLIAGAGKTAALMAGLAIGMSDAGQATNLSNTAMLGLAGTMAGPWGAAAGAAVGLMLDVRAAGEDMDAAISSADSALNTMSRSGLEQARDQLQSLVDAQRDAEDEMSAVGKSDRFLGPFAGLSDLDNVGAIFNQITGKADEAASKLERVKGALNGQTGLWDGLLAGMLGSSAAANRLTGDIAALGASFERLNSLLDVSGSLLAYEASLDALSASIKENGNAWNAGTEKGRSNLEARNRLVQDAIERSEALKEAGDDLGAQRILTRAISDLQTFAKQSPEARAAMKPFIKELRDLNGTKVKPKVDVDDTTAKQKINRAGDLLTMLGKTKTKPKVDADWNPLKGATDSALKALGNVNKQRPNPPIDANWNPLKAATTASLGALANVDKQHPNATIDANWDPLSSAVNAALGALDRVDGASASATITTTYRTINETVNKILPFTSAEGNLFPTVRSFSAGDIANAHQPQIAPAGAWRVWAEDETGGEAYIPLANDHRRGRAESILGDVAQRFGMRLERYAMGDVRQPLSRSSQSPSPSVNVAAPSLAGVRIDGRIERDRNGDEWLRGVVRDEIAAEQYHNDVTGARR